MRNLHNFESDVLFEGKEFDYLSNIFLRLTGRKATSFSFPGLRTGDLKGNRSLLVTTHNQEKIVLTYRSEIKLANLESVVLKKLSIHNAAVPRLIGSSGNWLAQQYMGKNLLSEALNTQDSQLKKIFCLRQLKA